MFSHETTYRSTKLAVCILALTFHLVCLYVCLSKSLSTIVNLLLIKYYQLVYRVACNQQHNGYVPQGQQP